LYYSTMCRFLSIHAAPKDQNMDNRPIRRCTI
jgi:hypothetical protein